MSDHVLVPVDDAPRSWDALDYALREHPDAEITVLHVLNPVEWLLADEDGSGMTEVAYDTARDHAERLLERAAERAGDRAVTTALVTGRPAREIVDYAEEHDVDHVVMGSHGRKGVARVLLGSVAETVVRRAPVPVTVVRAQEA